MRPKEANDYPSLLKDLITISESPLRIIDERLSSRAKKSALIAAIASKSSVEGGRVTFYD